MINVRALLIVANATQYKTFSLLKITYVNVSSHFGLIKLNANCALQKFSIAFLALRMDKHAVNVWTKTDNLIKNMINVNAGITDTMTP